MLLGWVQRREVESAKTIAQIHRDAANEARRSSSSKNLNRSASSNSIRRQSSKPSVDADGFTEVSGKSSGFGRSLSMGNFARNDSKTNLRKSEKSTTSNKSVSSGGSFAAFNNIASSSSSSPSKREKLKTSLPNVDEKKSSSGAVTYQSPEECGKKMKNCLKEYFVGGDSDDIVLSINEMIGIGADGSVERGSKIVEGGILMVLEMKAENVDKFVTIVTRCITEKKIPHESIVSGLNDPLEFLGDISIDAPLATSHLVTIVSAFIESGAVSFDFLLNTPEYFRSDGGAAQFGCKVLKQMGGDAMTSESNLDIITQLMTDSDKESFPNGAKAMLS